MALYYYFILFSVLLSIILFIRFVIFRTKNILVQLFNEALRNENSGHFEAAVFTYESALSEVEKIRFHNNLKNKIVEKLKLLRTVIEYKNNFHFQQAA